MAKIKSKQVVGKTKKVVVKSKKNLKKPFVKKTKIKIQEFETVPLDKSSIDKENEESSDSDILNSGNDENNRVSHPEDEQMENSGDNESEDEAETHKRDLEKLKKSDPEFYKFLQENDRKLLEFNLSDEEIEDEAEEDDENKGIHKPNGTLDVASDESDFEVIRNIIHLTVILITLYSV